VIVIDDHSDDKTVEIAKTFAKHNQHIIIQVVKNRGVGKAAALNHGYELAHGAGFILLAGDDIIVPELLLSRARAVVCDRPRIATCFYQTFSDDPRFHGIVLPRRTQPNRVVGGVTSFNRAFADLYFPIPEQLPNEDTWLRAVALLYSVEHHHIPAVGLNYRIHSGNSGGPLHSFRHATRWMASRQDAYSLALAKENGTEAGRRRLASIVEAERLRRMGRWHRIPWIRDLERGDMLMMIMNSNWLFYSAKRALFRIISSRANPYPARK
jgi:glycosyltransferase involved in cell wall biosynthesis